MSYRLEVRDAASNEFIEGYLWYENERDGLGEDFHDEVQEFFDVLRQRPADGGVLIDRTNAPMPRLIVHGFTISLEGLSSGTP